MIFTEGKNRTQDSVTGTKTQEGYMANINRLYYVGTLKLAGPFGEDGNWKAVFIFDLVAGYTTKEELETLLLADPVITLGRRSFNIHSYSTATTDSFSIILSSKKYWYH